jgi:hypothetical protein
MFCRGKLGLWATAGSAAWEPARGVGSRRPGSREGTLRGAVLVRGDGGRDLGAEVGLAGQFQGDGERWGLRGWD